MEHDETISRGNPRTARSAGNVEDATTSDNQMKRSIHIRGPSKPLAGAHCYYSAGQRGGHNA